MAPVDSHQEKTQGEEESQCCAASETPYSAFSKSKKRWIAFAVSFAAMFSGLSSFIYYPATSSFADALKTSIELINPTITFYQVISGVAPSIIGDMADQVGRRPVYIAAFAMYNEANLGLALQSSYPALLMLRMIQSTGSSGTIALAYGVISDMATPAERGSYVGILMLLFVCTNAAPSLGPFLGGVLAERLDWRCVFWLLSKLSGLTLLGFLLLFPETARACADPFND